MASAARLVSVLVGLVVLAAVGNFVFGKRDGPDASPPPAGAPAAARVQECAKVLKCTAAQFIREASDSCKAPIEQFAAYAPRWTHATGDPIFHDYAWLVAAQGTITYFGNRAEFGSAAGTYSPVAYECDYDPSARKVLDVRVKGGAAS